MQWKQVIILHLHQPCRAARKEAAPHREPGEGPDIWMIVPRQCGSGCSNALVKVWFKEDKHKTKCLDNWPSYEGCVCGGVKSALERFLADYDKELIGGKA